MDKINLEAKFALVADHWHPRIIAELNGQQVKIAKVQGEFVWHKHDREDELFLVVRGELTIQFRDREVVLRPGELMVVPAGVEHRPVAREETHIVLFEPASTLNTGDAEDVRTVSRLEWV